jgi:hypothetical protein
MPRTCVACTHPDRDNIDRLLLEGSPLRSIAKRYSLSAAGLFRHSEHISSTLATSHKAAEILRGDDLVGHMNHLMSEAERLKRKAEKAKDYRTALLGVREISRLLELKVRSAIAMQEREPEISKWENQPVRTLTMAQLLKLLAREKGFTEAQFQRLASGTIYTSDFPIESESRSNNLQLPAK